MMKLAQGYGLDGHKLLILEADTEEECLAEARRIDGVGGLQPGALVKSPDGVLFVVVRPSKLTGEQRLIDRPGRYDIAQVEPLEGSNPYIVEADWPLDKFTVVRR